MRLLHMVTPFAVALSLTACQEAPEKKAPAPGNAAAAQPAAAAAQGPLAVYEGKTIFEPVEGEAFADNDGAAAAVGIAVRNEEPSTWVFRRDAQHSPIALRDGRLLAHGCERGNCAGRNWTILIDTFGAMAEVCYHEGGRSRWWGSGRLAAERPGPCPTA
jgi:hypothetical protein